MTFTIIVIKSRRIKTNDKEFLVTFDKSISINYDIIFWI